MKKTTKDAVGTSFHGTVINSSIAELKRVLGEPETEQNDGSDKVNVEWIMETEAGDVFTVYDWKEYRPIDENESIEFHIGGDSASVTVQAQREIITSL